MQENFSKAVDFTLSWEGEGGKADPGDPGGLTKWGITKRSFPDVDVANLTREQAIDLYHKYYWQRMGCDGLASPLDIVVFDTGVNCGPGNALGWLQGTNSWEHVLLKRAYHYTDLARQKPYFKTILFGLMRRVCAVAALAWGAE